MMDLADKVAAAGYAPGDPESVRARKRIAANSFMATTLVSLLWGASYTCLGLGAAQWVGYAAALLHGSLWLLYRCGVDDRRLLPLHVGANLLLPFAAQSLLGGIHNSGCLGLWAMVAPLQALVLEWPQAWGWFLAFVALQLGSALAEPSLLAHAPALPTGLPTLYLAANLSGVLALLFFPLAWVNRQARELRERLTQQGVALALEHHRADRLLMHALPQPLAARLQDNASMVVDAYPDVSVLVAELVPVGGSVSLGRLADAWQGLRDRFDGLAAGLGLESMQADGISYLAVGNVPSDRVEHLARMAELALGMHQAFHALTLGRAEAQGLDLRVGLHCGPVIAGVLGQEHHHYEIWGDSLALAARLEQLGLPGRTLVSQAAYEQLKGDYRFNPNGTQRLRGNGVMQTWWLVAREPGSQRWQAQGGPTAPTFI